jgi:hypothetical protein
MLECGESLVRPITLVILSEAKDLQFVCVTTTKGGPILCIAKGGRLIEDRRKDRHGELHDNPR